MQGNRSRRFPRATRRHSGNLMRDKVLFMIGLFIVGGAVLLYPGYLHLREFRHRLEQLKVDVSVLEEKKRGLEEEIDALQKDSFYFEKLAREMGLIKDGEVVYKVIEEESSENIKK